MFNKTEKREPASSRAFPPRFAKWLFGRLLLEDEVNEKLGDLEEAFGYTAERMGVFKARLWYGVQILKAIPACLENITYWRCMMIKNYLKTALRNIKKNKTISFINIFGLSIGIAFFILVFLFVSNEYSHDRFHKNHKTLYRILSEHKFDNQQRVGTYTPMRLADDLKRLYPEIDNIVRISRTSCIVRNDASSFREKICYVEKNFFNVFSFPILNGDMSNPLKNLHSIVISKEMAQKYFQNQNPVGQKLNIEFYDRKRDFYVSAVYDKKLNESSLVYDFLVPFDVYLERYKGKLMMTSYGAFGGETYLKLNVNANVKRFEKKLGEINEHIKFGLPEGRSVNYSLQPLKDIHLNNRFSYSLTRESNPVYSYVLAGLGLLVLLIGCINFLILALGRSATRAKEVGIRKVVGANRCHLAGQYLSEAVLTSGFSLLAGVGLASIMLPAFNELANKAIVFRIDIPFLAAVVTTALLVGLIAGSYPAVVLSGFQPVRVLKGSHRIKGKNNFSRILVTAQFMVSIFLIIAALTMQKQLNFMTEMNLGFERERLVEIAMNSSEEVSDQVFQRFKNEIAQQDGILNISAAATPYGTDWTRLGIAVPEKGELKFYFNQVDYDYIKTMGIKMIAGRNFSREYGTDKTNAVIANEKFVKQFGLKEPLTAYIPGPFKNKPKIIGVVEDFNFASLHEEIQPLIMGLSPDVVAVTGRYSSFNTPGWPSHLDYVIVRIGQGDIMPVIHSLEKTWKKVSPGSPVEINFVDDTINRHYQSEKRWGKTINIASILAILIASLGLFGLSMLSTEKRSREIGIRKVLGAATGRLVLFITKEQLLLVAVANIFAWPFSYFIMNRWLQNFAYKTGINLSIFIISAFLAMSIAIITISYQTIKAALLNPIDVIRCE